MIIRILLMICLTLMLLDCGQRPSPEEIATAVNRCHALGLRAEGLTFGGQITYIQCGP